MHRFHRRDFVGRQLVDCDGYGVGVIADTWPQDGGGEPQMLLVKLGRFAMRRFVPLANASLDEPGRVRVPWSRLEIDDAPDAEDLRWGDPGSVSRAHWLLAGDD